MSYTQEVEETEDGTLYRAIHDIEIDWSDQTGWFDPSLVDTVITIIGCGGIGSNVAYEFITMGIRRFVLYDDDVVEPRNLGSQKAYPMSGLYRPKAEALADVLFQYGATEILVRKRLFTADDTIDDALVIGAVDSMKSRKIIWEAISNSPAVELYLDGRLEGEVAQVFAVDPLDPDWYTTNWLFSDEEASQGGNCTMRTIVYPATAMASVMCRHLSSWYQADPIDPIVMIDMANLELVKVGAVK